MYRQDALGLRTKFPFGFLQKTRRVDADLEIVAYPAVRPSDEFFEVLPLVTGARGGSVVKAAARSGVAVLFMGGVNATSTLAALILRITELLVSAI